MLERASGKVNARMHLAVIATGCSQRKVCFLFEKQYVELIS